MGTRDRDGSGVPLRLAASFEDVWLDQHDLCRTIPPLGDSNSARRRPWIQRAEPMQLLYMNDRHYNPADELRRPYNDPNVAYDWETQHK